MGVSALMRIPIHSVPWLWWTVLCAAAAGTIWSAIARFRGARGDSSLPNARFARCSDLRRLRRHRDAWFPLGYVLAARSRRRLWSIVRSAGLRRTLAGPLLRLPEEDLARHVLVVGLTGAGKTSAVTIPVLLEAANQGISVVAFDLKHGEDDSLARAAPAWRRCGRDVWIFAPLDRGSLRWNPLEGCRSIGTAARLAAMLFDDAGQDDPDVAYWISVERHVCAVVSLAVATDGGENTFGRVRALCEAGPEAVRAYIRSHPAVTTLERHLGAYRAMLPKDEAGILQGVAARLEPWTDDAVCRATSSGEPDERLDLGRLRREPVLFLVGIPQASLGRLRWLWHLFLRDLTSRLLCPREPGESIRVLQVLEELPAWGLLPGLADHLATLRSRQVSMMATIQSEAQGELVYGRTGWAAIAANLVTKAYVAPLADFDAQRLSGALGTTIVYDVSRSRTWSERGSQSAEHHRGIAVPLRRPEQLQGIDAEEDELLVRCPRLPPARLWCPPFYARPEYRGLVPQRPPTVGEIAVCHRLWMKRTGSADPACLDARYSRTEREGETQQSDGEFAARSSDTRSDPPRPGDAPPGDRLASDTGPTRDPLEAAVPVDSMRGSNADPRPDELAVLRRFVESLLARVADGPKPAVRMVLRGNRLVELRVDPAAAAALCGGPDAMQTLIRRWVELRWVRRVRPVLILERRAIEAATGSRSRGEMSERHTG